MLHSRLVITQNSLNGELCIKLEQIPIKLSQFTSPYKQQFWHIFGDFGKNLFIYLSGSLFPKQGTRIQVTDLELYIFSCDGERLINLVETAKTCCLTTCLGRRQIVTV